MMILENKGGKGLLFQILSVGKRLGYLYACDKRCPSGTTKIVRTKKKENIATVSSQANKQ